MVLLCVVKKFRLPWLFSSCVIHGIDMSIGTAKVPPSWRLVLYLYLIGLQEMLVLLMTGILVWKQHRCIEVNTGKSIVIQGRHRGIFQGKRYRNFEAVVWYLILVTLWFVYADVDSRMLYILLVMYSSMLFCCIPGLFLCWLCTVHMQQWDGS
jgi:hypothetical protein